MFIDENTPKDQLLKIIGMEPELVQAFAELNVLAEMQTKEYLFEVINGWVMAGDETHDSCH